MSKKIDRKELVAAINACAGLTEKQKGDLTQLLNETPKYGLVWEDTSEDAYEDLRTEVPVMYEDKSKAIINGSGYPNHVIIEGENLKALEDLSYTHADAFDVIYLDPPYNTGHKDFFYNDAFVKEDNGYRHSMWLSFMERRLRIAHTLLADDGVIFISIDDNEQAQLKLLCDQIFGASNCLATVVQKSRDSISGDLLFSPNHNYLLVYALRQDIVFKDKDNFRIPSKVDEKKYKNPDNDPRGPWKLNPVDGPGGARKGNPYYTFLGVTGYYRYSKEMMQKYYDEGLIIKRKTSLGKKYFLSQAKAKKGDPPTTWWDDAGKTTNGTKLLKQILPDCDFNNPKPIELIIRCLQLRKKDAKVLDFFAGSGTTLHATMELNKEDGGHRQCILVTNNENNICEDVTYPRNKKVIEGYDTPKGEHVEGLHDNNLRYFKMDSVPRKPLRQNRQRLAASMIDMLRIKHNVYTEKDHVGTLATNPQTTRYYEDNGHGLLLLMDSSRIGVMVDAIKSMDIKHIDVYVYSDGSYAFDEDFSAVADKVSVYAIPGPMLRNFNRIAPEMPEETIEEPSREMTTTEAEDNSDDYKGEEE